MFVSIKSKFTFGTLSIRVCIKTPFRTNYNMYISKFYDSHSLLSFHFLEE